MLLGQVPLERKAKSSSHPPCDDAGIESFHRGLLQIAQKPEQVLASVSNILYCMGVRAVAGLGAYSVPSVGPGSYGMHNHFSLCSRQIDDSVETS